MYIQGKEVRVTEETLPGIFKSLDALPSGFGKRAPNYGKIRLDPDDPDDRRFQNALTLMNQFLLTGQPDDGAAAALRLYEAEKAYKQSGNVLLNGEALLNYAVVLQRSGDHASAIEYYDTAIDLLLSAGRKDRAFYGIQQNHLAVATRLHMEEEAGNKLKAAELRGKLGTLHELAFRLAPTVLGESVNAEAYGVEEGEVGFSSSQLIGTSVIGDCLTLVIQDPQSKKTAVAHIHGNIEPESYRLLTEGLPNEGTPEQPLKARLIGALYVRADKAEGQNEALAKRSLNTLGNILKFLDGKNVDIVSADVFDPLQPTCVVVDPKTFALVEEAPGKPNPNAILIAGKNYLSQTSCPLHLAFDLTQSEERAPIFLDEQTISFLQDMVCARTPLQLVETFRDQGVPSRSYLCFMASIHALGKAYTEACNPISAIITNRLLADDGDLQISLEDFAVFIDALRTLPLYVGTNASIVNEPLIDFIDKDLFNKKDSEALDLDALRAFRFAGQPYDAISVQSKKPPARSLKTGSSPGLGS